MQADVPGLVDEARRELRPDPHLPPEPVGGSPHAPQDPLVDPPQVMERALCRPLDYAVFGGAVRG
jgi:hypothetical protein